MDCSTSVLIILIYPKKWLAWDFECTKLATVFCVGLIVISSYLTQIRRDINCRYGFFAFNKWHVIPSILWFSVSRFRSLLSILVWGWIKRYLCLITSAIYSTAWSTKGLSGFCPFWEKHVWKLETLCKAMGDLKFKCNFHYQKIMLA